MTDQMVQQSATTKIDVLHEPRLVLEQGLAARVASIIEPAIMGLGFRLVRVRMVGSTSLTAQIMVERVDGSALIEDCEAVSRAISPILDVEDPISRDYTLEVSSPGIDRPLVRVSDFERWTGHEMKLEMSVGQGGRKRFRGMIDGVKDDHLILRFIEPAKGEPERAVLPIGDIGEAKLMMTDDLVRASFRRSKLGQATNDQTVNDQTTSDQTISDINTINEPDADLSDSEVSKIRAGHAADEAAANAAERWQPKTNKPKPVKGPGRFAKRY